MSISTKINSLLESHDYDIRKSNNARFMDQKVTPDNLCIIADCIVNLLSEDKSKEFTRNDIWELEYFNKNVKGIFNKPDPSNRYASREYDKYISQPLKMLAYAGVLSIQKQGHTNYFKVCDWDILEFIASKVTNALSFLYKYIIEVLNDSDLYAHFERFRKFAEKGQLGSREFFDLKTCYEKFIIRYTPINTVVEVRRIFTKVLNIFSFKHNIKGTIAGRLSEHPIYYSDLMYNRINWRDVNKDKAITRQEAELHGHIQTFNENEAMYRYLMQKSINLLSRIHPKSEVEDDLANAGNADYAHHIFPRSQFKQLAYLLENLIKLTPAQHLSRAHPRGNTHIVDKDYQLICLLSKSKSIESSLRKGFRFYTKENFTYVINTGLSVDLSSSLSFKRIREELVSIYERV